MEPIDALKSILDNKYISEEGDIESAILKPGLSIEQINNLRPKLPDNYLPEDIVKLLEFSSGFSFYGVDQVSFDALGLFGFECMFPTSIQLAGDKFGNYWILDIDRKGNWGNVFFVCYEPAVIIKHSKNLSEFIIQVGTFGKAGSKLHRDIINEKLIIDIWTKHHGLMTPERAKRSDDITLRAFANTLPPNFLIADLRENSNSKGFCWGKLGLDSQIIRHETELLWAVETESKKSFFKRWFSPKLT
jgi:hypothetical protein